MLNSNACSRLRRSNSTENESDNGALPKSSLRKPLMRTDAKHGFTSPDDLRGPIHVNRKCELM